MIRISIPEETIKRLPLYLRYLNFMVEGGKENITSKDLAEQLNLNPGQIRRDLSWFGEFGTQGVGYDTKRLVKEIRSILNLNMKWAIALVGIGNIGQALLNYPGFAKQGLEMQLAFDNNSKLIGKKIGGVTIEDVANLERRVKEKGIKLGIIAVPFSSAQTIAESLVSGGVKGILNFAPRLLHLPDEVKVNYVDIAVELGHLVYCVGSEEMNLVGVGRKDEQ